MFIISPMIQNFFLNKQANGLRYWRWGGRGLCLGVEKLEARKMLEKPHRTHLSSAPQ